ncbi:curli production assembly protein CsgG [Methylobacterium terrae]|uniref:Curli production assembly protein CsgG n=1 Tax=Methylobacterium terrae TaxID=2202827 RepID=A0A2U8WPK5_9HYPH|nr:CsgG/HfaB family protein [Methylobacterium terrae]AWN47390.1 curli production assembly protein CsgG [Methylobacterium terrae]
MTSQIARILALLCSPLALAGCQTVAGEREILAEAPQVTPSSPTGIGLESLPPPQRPIDVALYAFPDLTGQNKPSDNFAEYSRAVTQGGSAFVVDALRRAGGGRWFNVVERGGLQALLQERQLIRATRVEYQGASAAPLPPLRFAGLILEGGILAYDANTVTGGFGARYLGIGADTKYRRDAVTVALRLVSVQSGQVLLSVTTTKTIYSVLVDGSTYKFIAIDKILEAEAGFSRNEPTQLAVREAIELGVYALIMEGAEKGLWKFRTGLAAAEHVKRYKSSKPLKVKAEIPSDSDRRQALAEAEAAAPSPEAASMMLAALPPPAPPRADAKPQPVSP